MTSGLRIEYVPLAELLRWPRNPKQHDLVAIHQSVARFGFVNPIIVNEASGLILAGHGRLDTLLQRQASSEPLPQGLRSENGAWLVPVVMGVSLSSEEAEAYAIADNRTVELGGWGEARLAEVLSDLAAMPQGLDGVGYDGDDLDQLLRDLRAPDTREDNPNIVSKADELQEKWQVERGQVWRCGPHRVMCGDATSDADVAKLMAGQNAVLLAADPPWNVGWGYPNHFDDDKSPIEYGQWLSKWLEVCKPLLVIGALCFVWQAMRNCRYFSQWFLEDYRLFAECQNFSQVTPRPMQNSWNPIIWWQNGGKSSVKPQAGRRDFFVSNTAKVREPDDLSRLNTAARPLDSVEYLVAKFGQIGAIVLDPFLGSGTTLIAAEKLGRICFGMEIHPPYVAVTLERYQNFTGDTPRLADES